MNKNLIKSAVSIEFALSIEKAGKIVDSIFSVLEESLIKNKKIELQKFGKITVMTKRDAENNKIKTAAYIPSKKLAKRVNYNFDNLKKVRMEFKMEKDRDHIYNEIDNCNGNENGNVNVNKDTDKLEYEMSKDFKREFRENKDQTQDILQEETIEPAETLRTLISDKLIKLHYEITEEEVEVVEEDVKKSDENSLWR